MAGLDVAPFGCTECVFPQAAFLACLVHLGLADVGEDSCCADAAAELLLAEHGSDVRNLRVTSLASF